MPDMGATPVKEHASIDRASLTRHQRWGRALSCRALGRVPRTRPAARSRSRERAACDLVLDLERQRLHSGRGAGGGLFGFRALRLEAGKLS